MQWQIFRNDFISVRETVLAGLGDMMIDGVVPLVCGRAGLSRPSGPCRGTGSGGRDGAGRRPRGWPRCIGFVRAAAFTRISLTSPARGRRPGRRGGAGCDGSGGRACGRPTARPG